MMRSISRSISRSIPQGSVAYSPATLFASGEQGAWYDPSDISTMFQDAAGTIPAVADMQVGLILDKRLGLIRGAELVTDPELTTNNSPVEWVAVGTGGANTITFSGGALTFVTDGTNISLQRSATLVVGKVYEATVNVSAVSGAIPGIYTGTVDIPFATGTGIRKLVFTASSTTLSIKRMSGAAGTFTLDSVSVRELPGNHATQSTASARPILRQSGALWFLEFDGVNDFLVTPSINFTTQSEMSIFAGVAKISDAAIGTLIELSSSIAANNFAFAIQAPSAAASATYRAQFKGTLLSECLASGYAAPNAHVLSAICSIDFNQFLRVSGTLIAGNNLQGTGNFGNYPIYIGMRAGTTLPFKGYMASMIIRGKYSNAQSITDTEKYVATKSGVTL